MIEDDNYIYMYVYILPSTERVEEICGEVENLEAMEWLVVKEKWRTESEIGE